METAQDRSRTGELVEVIRNQQAEAREQSQQMLKQAQELLERVTEIHERAAQQHAAALPTTPNSNA